jgi:hypothetical protein
LTRPLAVGVAAALLLGVSGCSGPVPVTVPSPAPEVAEVCRAVTAALPDRVLDAEHRDTEPPSDLTAAWGDPPIEYTCGVAPPTLTGSAAQCFEVNGIGWYAEPRPNGTIFTTYGRKVYVELAVPTAYAPEANALTDLSGPIATHNPQVTPCT